MSARSNFCETVWETFGIAAEELSGMLDAYEAAHAHELAEKQREHLRRQGYELDCICDGCSACLATEYIDLIDPEVSNG
ncbi:hypothetical protein [Streptomyces sp. t39]|uniref:hypothetical protein n=1 Tax=Streptomyces sp. t39 TaxID=1828156 RepID=UPI0011CE6BEC|nr:hypothetical protein [Streptomyces sp. t39]TXS35081.1 hypothetical protein EAO77_37940 [Streptomyces sp. t39]